MSAGPPLRLPAALATAPGATPLIMDRYNTLHRPVDGSEHEGACGTQGIAVTLTQGMVWGSGWCPRGACYEPPYVGRRRS